MTEAVRKYYTPEEYLALEEVAEYKSEYYRGEIYQMSGGTFNHNVISGNIYAELNLAFRKKNCTAFNSDMRLQLKANGLYTYPDVSVICGPVQFAEGRRDTITNPTLVVEVLSSSTANYDRGGKFTLYQGLESLRDYVLVEQDSWRVEYFRKLGPKHWDLTILTDPSTILNLSTLEVEIPLALIYDKVVFEELP